MKKYHKAFNRNMTCRDQQYEEGGVYELPAGEKRMSVKAYVDSAEREIEVIVQ